MGLPDLKYFKLEEFDSSDFPGSGINMHPEFLERIDEVRHFYGKPIVITSAYRTIYKNQEVGGKLRSSHLDGLAVDVKCTNSRERFELLDAFLEVGFTRFGIGNLFLHADLSDQIEGQYSGIKTPNVIWTY